MRIVTEYVSQWSCGRYFLFWRGDEFLLKSVNDQDAIQEAAALMAELEQE